MASEGIEQAVVEPRTGPKWQAKVMDRVKDHVRRFSRPTQELLDRDANEGDTRLLVTDFLSEALGYDKYTDLSTEYRVRGEFADYAIRIDKQTVALVEVKRISTKLGIKHLRQVETYALNEGVEWVVLTNGAEWHVYHLTAALPMQVELAFKVNLLDPDLTVAQKAEKLFYLTLESFKRRQIDELWLTRRATSPDALAKAILSEKVIGEIRKELWRQTGHRASEEEVVRLLQETVLRLECLR